MEDVEEGLLEEVEVVVVVELGVELDVVLEGKTAMLDIIEVVEVVVDLALDCWAGLELEVAVVVVEP